MIFLVRPGFSEIFGKPSCPLFRWLIVLAVYFTIRKKFTNAIFSSHSSRSLTLCLIVFKIVFEKKTKKREHF